jgi:hypothetical protein
MSNVFQTITIAFAAASVWLALLSNTAHAQGGRYPGIDRDASTMEMMDQAPALKRRYWVDTYVFSIVNKSSDANLDSFQGHGGGGVSSRGRLSLAVSHHDRKFTVSLDGSEKKGRFLIQVDVIPDKNDRGTAALKKEVDLTDLKPVTLELARDDDGRIYRLNLSPTIAEVPLPKPFRASDLALEKWSFQGSTVILNDQDYMGQMNMGAAPIAFIDIPGLAKIEFSLLKLTDAEPSGTLQDGTLRIKHKDQALRVTDVRNGIPPETLRGGPYQVWVRWLKPSQTIEQYREEQNELLATLKSGDTSKSISIWAIERVLKLSESGRVLEMSSGIRGAKKGEIKPSDTSTPPLDVGEFPIEFE